VTGAVAGERGIGGIPEAEVGSPGGRSVHLTDRFVAEFTDSHPQTGPPRVS
jgi:hypothetical protein